MISFRSKNISISASRKSSGTSRRKYNHLESDHDHHDIAEFSENEHKIEIYAPQCSKQATRQYCDSSSASYEPDYHSRNKQNDDHSYGICRTSLPPLSSMDSFGYSNPLSAPPLIVSNQDQEIRCSSITDTDSADLTSFSLSMPDDKLYLSERQTFVRQNLIEVFCASEEDVRARHKRGSQKLVVGQVGIRCIFCNLKKGESQSADTSLSRKRSSSGSDTTNKRGSGSRNISFPSSVSRLYQACADMERFHLQQCQEIPHFLQEKYKVLRPTRKRSTESPQSYWINSAKRILEDTPDQGIRVLSGSKHIAPVKVCLSVDSDESSVANGNIVHKPIPPPQAQAFKRHRHNHLEEYENSYEYHHYYHGYRPHYGGSFPPPPPYAHPRQMHPSEWYCYEDVIPSRTTSSFHVGTQANRVKDEGKETNDKLKTAEVLLTLSQM